MRRSGGRKLTSRSTDTADAHRVTSRDGGLRRRGHPTGTGARLFLITGLSATASIRAPSYISMRTNAGGSPRRLSIQNSWTVLVLGGVELHRTRAQHRLTLGAA